MGVKRATLALIRIDVLVNPLWADAWQFIGLEVATDLFRSPIRPKHLLNTLPRDLRYTQAAPLNTPCTSQPICLLRAVTFQACVAT